jgi:phosphoadenosine phosphosulfate reductase
VVFIDTGYHFPETLEFGKYLTKRLGLDLQVYSPLKSAKEQEKLYGKLWEQGVEGIKQYNQMNKSEWRCLLLPLLPLPLLPLRFSAFNFPLALLSPLPTPRFLSSVEPMQRAIKELKVVGWMTGLRRAQSSTREHLKVLQIQDGVVKIHPLVDWNNKKIHYYLKEHDLPYHPLWEKGYVSIGDWHSTVPLSEGMKEEETRFKGLKRECGLHEPLISVS